MKTLLIALALSFAGILPAGAADKIYRVYEKVNFEAGTGHEYAQNLMDDGIVVPDGYDFAGFGISFVLFPGETFKIRTQAEIGSDDEMPKCKYSEPRVKEIRRGRRLVWIDVDPSLSNGKQATVQYYETGT